MKFWMSLFLVFSCYCKTANLVLKEPDKATKPGLIAFGLFIYDDTSTPFFEKNASFKLPVVTKTFFYAVDPLKRELIPSSRIYIHPPSNGEEIEINGKLYKEQNRIIVRDEYITYFLFSDLEEIKEYILESTEYSFTTVLISVRGKRTNQLNYVNIPLQLNDPSKILKFKATADKILFLGNFVVRVKIEKKGKFLDFDEKKIGIVEKAEGLVISSKNNELIQSLYGQEEISERGAEIHFLKKILANAKEGYWKRRIDEKLREVSKN